MSCLWNFEVLGWSLDASAMREIDHILILAQTIADPMGPEFMTPPD